VWLDGLRAIIHGCVYWVPGLAALARDDN